MKLTKTVAIKEVEVIAVTRSRVVLITEDSNLVETRK